MGSYVRVDSATIAFTSKHILRAGLVNIPDIETYKVSAYHNVPKAADQTLNWLSRWIREPYILTNTEYYII